MLGDSGIAITLTKCRACSATMHILMKAKKILQLNRGKKNSNNAHINGPMLN
jgi:hypothetical protein